MDTAAPSVKSIGELVDLLAQAAQLEHLLAMEYLFAAFSLKKYPEEFDACDRRDPAVRHRVEAQVERNRRWAAQVLFVARQEMEHLAMVQNLLAILDEAPTLWRPNFPVPRKSYPLGPQFALRRLNEDSLATFRYYEKPESLDLPLPPGTLPQDLDTPFVSSYGSLQELYEEIETTFCALLSDRRLQGCNPTRVVNEHFGFNIDMDPLVIGQYDSYIHAIIGQILEEGEGVGEETPPLGSHFMAFQQILTEYEEAKRLGHADDPVLPVVDNPTILGAEYHGEGTHGTPITNPHGRAAVALFNDAYVLMTRMLTGFFAHYEVDTTTGIHPPRVNAYFQTAFYPFMTMVIRPLGELVCRLPADADYRPERGKLPPRCAGPSFEIRVAQGPNNGDAKRASVAAFHHLDEYERAFDALIEATEALRIALPDDYAVLGGRGFKENLEIVGQNLWRMRSNFGRYWKGEMVAPLPSRDFTDFGGTPLN